MAHTLSTRRYMLAILGGGFCGTLCRVLLSSLLQRWLGKAWPYDILLINVTGALLLALVTTLADATLFVGPTRRLFLNVGVLGAYTTFSTLALGDVLLISSGHWIAALIYVISSGLGGIIAVLAGDALGHWCIRRAHPSRLVKTTQKLPGLFTPTDETATHEHVDVQDDLLLQERE